MKMSFDVEISDWARTTYDEVLNCPDTPCRREALDKLCKEKIAEGMEKAADTAKKFGNMFSVGEVETFIRQAAEDLEDS